MQPKNTAYQAMVQITASAPVPGQAMSTTPKAIEMRPLKINHHSFVEDIAHPDGGKELKQADNDRPYRNEHQQNEGGHSGVGKRNDAGENTDGAAQAQPPARTGI